MGVTMTWGVPALAVLAAMIGVMRPGRLSRGAVRAIEALMLAALAVALGAAALLVTGGPGSTPGVGWHGLGLSVRLDAVSAVMLVLVGFIGWVVVRFAATYLDGEARQGWFMAWLCATLASVLAFVIAGNLVLLVATWIATSIGMSRLLVFYPERAAARRAARKKFIVARSGDAALMVAAALMVTTYGTGDIAAILAAARSGAGGPMAAAAAALLALAALLKSAQFPVHGWVTEVMEAPTPVSALLHAGVINAGGFLLIRFGDVMLLSPAVLAALVIIGGFTALFGGMTMLTQPGVKTSLAWSTIAQMGFMIMQCGLALFPLALLHIVAHSLYKAHAFLSSGGAVERIAAFRRPGAVAVPGTGAVARAFLVALGIYAIIQAAMAATLGALHQSPQAMALGAILIFGVAYLVAQGLAEAAPRALTRRLVVMATLASLGYFALHLAAEWLAGSSVPPAPAPGPLEWVLIVLAVTSFGLVAVAQAMLPLWAHHPAAMGLRVHLSNGLYVNAVVDRIMGRRPIAAGASAGAIAGNPGAIAAAAQAATAAIPPAWPLAATVAVNPYLGHSGDSLAMVAARLDRVAGAPATLPRRHYAGRIAAGAIGDADLDAALAQAPSGRPGDLTALKAAIARDAPAPVALPTVADLAAAVSGIDWPAIVADRFGHWAAAWFDAGQALWAAPRGRSAWAAWRAFAQHDLTPEIRGAHGFAGHIAAAPEAADAALAEAVARLGIPPDAMASVFHQALITLGGWAQMARHRRWQAELAGADDATITDFLAIRLWWEVALFETHGDAVRSRWAAAVAVHAMPLVPSADQIVDAILQDAADHAAQRALAATMATPVVREPALAPALQMAFCIDVRSEVFRRGLESLDPRIRTLGFAGFFGLTVAHRGRGSDVAELRLPVLLNPGLASRAGGDAPADVAADVAARLDVRASRAWARFKLAAVSSFAFVEAAGPIYAGKLVRDTLGLAGGDVGSGGDDPAPRFDPAPDFDSRLGMAETVLRAMSLTRDFAPLVIIAGHGARVVNNPHASALQCGACGGYSGEVNARLLAGLLNDAAVRSGLVARGIAIPPATLFVAALHDTTTDAVTLHEGDAPGHAHGPALDQARQWLAAAGRLARAERALTLPHAGGGASLPRRARDWAETRPEWGLAGCSAFIAAPRRCTSGRDLAGRAFLHDYDWQQDDGFGVLELILTAPVVVASWISLQYYGSSVAPALFGAGNKLLHNVVGGFGVVEGNGGTLRTGLPWQSVHDGERLVHDPLRLAVCIAAPPEAMTAILARHAGVRALFDNRWLYLFALDAAGRMAWRYGVDGWDAVDPAAEAVAA